SFGQHPRAKPPWPSSGHASVEDQLHLVGASQIQVLADDLLEKDASGQGPVENLRQGELCLQDGHVVAVASLAILGRERVGQPCQPLAQQGAGRSAYGKLLPGRNSSTDSRA